MWVFQGWKGKKMLPMKGSLTQTIFLTLVEEEVEMEIGHCSVSEIGFLEAHRLDRETE